MKTIFTFLIILYSLQVSSQSQKLIVATVAKTEQFSNGHLVFNICKTNPSIIFNENLEYFWYNEVSKVKGTMGGSGGNFLHGKSQFFDEKGNLILETNYYLGLKDGVQKAWDSSGKVIAINKYNRGIIKYSKFKADGSDDLIEWIGPALEVGSIKNVYTSYGHLEQSEVIISDTESKVTEYFLNNNIKSKYSTHFFTIMNGEFTEYYENNKIKIHGKYDNDRKTGIWNWYNEDGTIKISENHRINKQYYPNGKLMAEIGEYFNLELKDWERDGICIWFKENGVDIDKVTKYKYGEIVE